MAAGESKAAALLGCVLVSALVSLGVGAIAAPPPAKADAPGWTGAFRLAGTNGYSVLALAFSGRSDGRGTIDLFVGGRHGGAVYAAPATVTPKKIEADLGTLGAIDVDLVGTGKTKAEHSACDRTPTRFEAAHYQGQIEFHGEEGYTDAIARRAELTMRPILNIACPGFSSQEIRAADLPGARLRTLSRGDGRSVSLQVNKNRPMARVVFSASVRERVGPIRIQRAVQGAASAGAFAYDQELQTAVLSPPAPFSGSATFRRGSGPGARWTGSLSVDFPGRSGVPLTGAEVHAHLVHAQRRVEFPLQ